MAKAKIELQPTIQRGRIDKLVIYEVHEAELDALERGSIESS